MNFIFDFDGTIADSIDIIIDSINEVVPGITRLDLAKEEAAFLGQTTLKYILTEFRWKELKVLINSRIIRKNVKSKMKTCKPYEGMVDVLNQLNSEGHFLALLTSSNDETVRAFLSENKIHSFKEIITGVPLFKKTKVIQHLLETKNLIPDESFYIGDEQRDREAALEAGITPISVSWGIYPPEQFEKQNIPYIKRPQDILKFAK